MQHQETHWSRILFHDLFEAPPRAERARVVSRQKEIRMNTRQPQQHDPAFGRSPLGSAVILLGIYIAMYLAVAGIVHALSPSESATVHSLEMQTLAGSGSSMPAPGDATGANHARTD